MNIYSLESKSFGNIFWKINNNMYDCLPTYSVLFPVAPALFSFGFAVIVCQYTPHKKNLCTPSLYLNLLNPKQKKFNFWYQFTPPIFCSHPPRRICKNECSCIQAVPQSIKSFFSWHCEIFRASNDIVTVCACKPRVSVINSMLRHMS